MFSSSAMALSERSTLNAASCCEHEVPEASSQSTGFPRALHLILCALPWTFFREQPRLRPRLRFTTYQTRLTAYLYPVCALAPILRPPQALFVLSSRVHPLSEHRVLVYVCGHAAESHQAYQHLFPAPRLGSRHHVRVRLTRQIRMNLSWLTARAGGRTTAPGSPSSTPRCRPLA